MSPLYDESRRCRDALNHVLLLSTMPKKTEAGLVQVRDRLSAALKAEDERQAAITEQ